MVTDKNKKRNDMKNDILEILQQHKLGHIPDEQALNELCVLFSVVGRSEQLVCDCGNPNLTWYGNDDDKTYFCFECKKRSHKLIAYNV